MDIFQYRDDLIEDYSAYVKGSWRFVTLMSSSSSPPGWMEDSFGRNPWYSLTLPSSRTNHR